MAVLLKLLDKRLMKSLITSAHSPNVTVVCNYSAPNIASLGKGKKLKGQMGASTEKKVLPVETDVEKLVTYVCGSNIMKEGEDIQLKPDSEYPDWLWNLHIGKPKTLDEMDPNSLQYWRKVRKEGMKRKNLLLSKKR